MTKPLDAPGSRRVVTMWNRSGYIETLLGTANNNCITQNTVSHQGLPAMRHPYPPLLLFHVPIANRWVARTGWTRGNVSQALRYILLKFVYCRNRSSYENFKLIFCTCTQSMGLVTCTKFQLEILTINVLFSIVYFREIILESSRKFSEKKLEYASQMLMARSRLHNNPQWKHISSGTLITVHSTSSQSLSF